MARANLLKYRDQGVEIEYSIVEEPVENYEAAYKGFDVANSYEPAKISVPVNKTWDDADNQDGVRPESITVHLLADGVEVSSAVVGESDNWQWSFSMLPRFRDEGVEIAYSVTEDAVEGYSTTYDGFNITNTYTPGLTSVSMLKVWDDSDNADEIRPERVVVHLLADDVDTERSIELDAEHKWQGAFGDLPIYRDGGEKIVYSVTEDAVEDYEMAIAGEMESGFVVTNSHEPEEPDEPEPSEPDKPVPPEPDKPTPTTPSKPQEPVAKQSTAPKTGDGLPLSAVALFAGGCALAAAASWMMLRRGTDKSKR